MDRTPVKTTDAESSLEEMLDELYREFVLLAVQPGEWTARMFAERYELTPAQAHTTLQRAIKAGTVAQVRDEHGRAVQRDVHGHSAQVYRFTNA